jgi:hypothetical protein
MFMVQYSPNYYIASPAVMWQQANANFTIALSGNWIFFSAAHHSPVAFIKHLMALKRRAPMEKCAPSRVCNR